MIREYRVRWEIDLDADSPENAARKALAIQRDPHSVATHFEVFEIVDGEHSGEIVEPMQVGAFTLGKSSLHYTTEGGDRDERLRTID